MNSLDSHQPRLSLFWRVSIVWVAATLIWLLIGGLAHTFFGPDYSLHAHVMRAILASLLTLPMIAWAHRFLDRRPIPSLAVLRTAWYPLLVGMVCWLIPAAIGTALCLALGWVQITTTASLGEILALAGILFVLVFFYEALPEELIFRGYFYRNLAASMPLWMAILTQALLFTLWGLANGGENSLERSLLFFSFAVVVGIFRAVTGSVWAAIGFHLAFQTVAQLFGTVGGQFVVSAPQTLMVFAFAVLPFIIGLSLLDRFYQHRPNWQQPDPPPRLPSE